MELMKAHLDLGQICWAWICRMEDGVAEELRELCNVDSDVVCTLMS